MSIKQQLCNEGMTVLGEICGDNARAKTASQVNFEESRGQDKDTRKVEASTSLEQQQVAHLSHATPLVDTAIQNKDMITFWTNKQLPGSYAEVFHFEHYEIRQRWIDECC